MEDLTSQNNDSEQFIEDNSNPPVDNTENISSEPDKKETKFFTSRFVFIFLFSFGLTFTIFTFIFQSVFTSTRIVGESMKPTINKNYIEGVSNINKYEDCDIVFCYKMNSYQTNDIVVISNPDNCYIPEEASRKVSSIIKRIIACPGETITFYAIPNPSPNLYNFYYNFYNFKLIDKYGNPKFIDESYLDDYMYITDYEYEYNSCKSLFPQYSEMLQTIFENGQEYSIVLPENHYFVMGDNRNNSTDSRYFGLVKQEHITGKMVLHVEYGQTVLSAIWKAIFSNFNLPVRLHYEKKYI